MKNLKMKIMMFVLMAAPFAHAESVQWNIGRVQGEIETLADLQLQEAQAVASCHYCNLSTCAGGPTVNTSLPTRLMPTGSSRYQITIGAGVHKSGFLFKKLHSCSYRVYFAGLQAKTGNGVTGSVLLATSPKDAANPIFMDEMLAEGLTEKMSEPLRLEILQQGLADPAIVNLKQTPYFDGK